MLVLVFLSLVVLLDNSVGYTMLSFVFMLLFGLAFCIVMTVWLWCYVLL